MIILEAVEHAALRRGVVREAEVAKIQRVRHLYSSEHNIRALDNGQRDAIIPFIIIHDTSAVLAADQSIECIAVPAVRVLFSATVEVLFTQDTVTVQISRGPLFVVGVIA